MDIQPADLKAQGYVLLDELGHTELVPFIQTYIKKRTRYAYFYFLSNLVVFGVTGYFLVSGLNQPSYDFGNRFAHFAYGIALAFLLLPLHEYIHVLAYRSQGAKNTSYDANFRRFYFMALADYFVANKKEFTVVALAPFVVITGALLLSLTIVNPDWMLTVFGILLTHTAMCSGDFGLLSYFQYHKGKDVVTYDDLKTGRSYFYGKQTA